MAWLSGWNYRKSHTISGSSEGAQTDYQIKIVVHFGSGTDSGENVYCNSHSETDFDDIRFTKSDGTTLLDYWRQEYVSSDYAIFWVEIDSIPASPSTVDIYVYYGKSGASTTSSGANTFVFFEDFAGDLSAWSGDAIAFTVSGGAVYCSTTSKKIYPTGITTTNHSVEAKVKIDSGARAHIAIRKTDEACSAPTQDDGYDLNYRYPNSDINLRRGYSSCLGSTLDTDSYSHDSNWHQCYMRAYGTSGTNLEADFDGSGLSVGDSLHSSGVAYAGTDTMTSGSAYWDDFRIRKYVNPEPSHSTWGSEEAGGATTYTKTYTADTLLKALGVTKTYTTDLLLKAVDLTKTYTTDVLLQMMGLTKTYDADLLLKALDLTKTYTAEVLLKALDLLKTYTADVLLQSPGLTKTYTADLLLQLQDLTKTYTADMVLKAVDLTKTYTADLLLKAAGLTKTYTADVILSAVALFTKTYTADVLLKALGVTKTYEADLLLQITDQLKTYTADVILNLVATKAYTADLVLKALGVTKTYTADIVIGSAGLGYTQGASLFTRGSDLYSQNTPIFERN